MTAKNKLLTGWIISGLASLMLIASAFDKIIGSEHALHMGTSFGLSVLQYRILGGIELISVVLFLLPRTGIIGLLLLSSYLGGAIATHLQHQQNILFPALFEALIWLGAVLRFSELIQRVSLKIIKPVIT